MSLFRSAYQTSKRFVASSRGFWYRRGYVPQDVEPGAYPFPKRQVPAIGRKSFKERYSELNPNSASCNDLPSLDIGLSCKLSPLLPNRPQLKRLDLEANARKRTLEVPLDLVHTHLEDTQAAVRRFLIAHHYGVFRDLFGYPHFFIPSVNIDVCFLQQNAEPNLTDPLSNGDVQTVDVQPVYMGNFITPTVTMMRPLIDLSSASSDHLWTVVLTCPDEPMSFSDNSPPPNEYIHWMVTNLKGGCSTEHTTAGDEVVCYLPPLPYLGTGYHRYIFVLYRQENGPLDLSEWKRDVLKGDLHTQRHFQSAEFCRRLESHLTPAGLVFFQSSWDESVRFYFRNVLDAHEPLFQLEWPTLRVPPQEKFPVTNIWNKARRHPHGLPLIRERYGVHNDVSFDVYMDRYRDTKDLSEELVRERLKLEGNPLDPNDLGRQRVEYPAAIPMPRGMPTWWRNQETQRRLRIGRWKHLNGHDG